jgi:hypothetical protein
MFASRLLPAALTLLLSVPASAQIADHLKCYKIKDSLKLAARADLDTPQFGLDPGCKLSEAKLFCVPATKTNVSATDKKTHTPIIPQPVDGPNPGDRICYKVKCEAVPSPQQVTDQFGTRTLSKLKASLVCTPAVKGAGTTTTTTTTLPSTCACGTPEPRQLKFVTMVGPGTTGAVLDDDGTALRDLFAGGLYFGGSGVGVPLPAEVPDTGTFYVNVTSCTPTDPTVVTLAATAPGDPDPDVTARTCTSAGVSNGIYPRDGCLFGPPLPIPNASAVGTSTCVINRVAGNVTGTARCDTGESSISLPLLSDLYLFGDYLDGSSTTGPNPRPDVPGIQPCPLCDPDTLQCIGGPRHGLACTPGSGDLGDAYPTSHDCPPLESSNFVGSIPIAFALTTGTTSMTSVDLPNQPFVFCGFCGNPFGPTYEGQAFGPGCPCTADNQCTSGTCTAGACVGGTGDCVMGPARACTSNADCAAFTTGCAGPCTACKQRNPGAFNWGSARTVMETGSPAGDMTDGLPHAATLASVFCIPPSFNNTVDSAADLPAPGAVALPVMTQLLP